MNEKDISKNVLEMAVVNTDNLSFVKNGSTEQGAFTVSIFLKNVVGSEQYGLMFFTQQPEPKVIVFKNVCYDVYADYSSEIELYKQHISQTTGIDYSLKGVGFKAKMNVDIDVQGFTSKQVVDEDGKPVFNEDGTPKMVDKPFSSKGTLN